MSGICFYPPSRPSPGVPIMYWLPISAQISALILHPWPPRSLFFWTVSLWNSSHCDLHSPSFPLLFSISLSTQHLSLSLAQNTFKIQAGWNERHGSVCKGGLLDHTYVISTPNIVLSIHQAVLQTLTQLTPHSNPVRAKEKRDWRAEGGSDLLKVVQERFGWSLWSLEMCGFGAGKHSWFISNYYGSSDLGYYLESSLHWNHRSH